MASDVRVASEKAVAKSRLTTGARRGATSKPAARREQPSPYDDAPIGVYRSSTDGKLLYANKALARMLGYKTPQAAVRQIRDLGDEIYADPAQRRRVVRQALEQGDVVVTDVHFRRHGGGDWVAHLHMHVVHEADSVYLEGFIEDVTERWQAEAALRDGEERYRTLVEQAADMISVHDLDGHFIEANQAACDMLGYSREELLRMNVADIDPDLIARGDIERFWGGPATTLQARHRRKDGSTYPVEVRVGPINAGGRQLMLGVSRDLSARAAAEDEQRRHYESLETINGAITTMLGVADETTMCQTVVAAIRRLVPVGMIAATLISADGRTMRVVTVDGFEEHMERVNQLYGGNPFAREFSTARRTQNRFELAVRGKLALLEGGLYELAMRSVPKALCRATERELGVERVYTCGFSWGGRHYGGAALMLPAGYSPEPQAEAIEAIVRQAAIALQRIRAEGAMRVSEERLHRALDGAVEAMGVMVETKDPYTAGHERRVAAMATAIGQALGLDAWRLDGLRIASQVHDIGKIAVPAEILVRPGRLTEIEFEVVRGHAQAGYEILKSIDFEWPVAQMVLEHHERLDGSGYPRGLSGAAISAEARILAVADVVEAMASDRPYRPALGMEAALAEIEAQRGRLFDSAVVDACVSAVRERGFTFAA